MPSAAESFTSFQKQLTGMLPGPGRDGAVGHGVTCEHTFRTVYYKLGCIWSTELQSWADPRAIHHKMEMVRPGLSPSRTRGCEQTALAGIPDTHVIRYGCTSCLHSLQVPNQLKGDKKFKARVSLWIGWLCMWVQDKNGQWLINFPVGRASSIARSFTLYGRRGNRLRCEYIYFPVQ